MTGIPGTVGKTDWTLPRAPGRLKTERRSRLESITVPSLALRALAFLAFAIFAAAHWTALVDPPQTRRAFVAAIVVTLGGVLLTLSGRLPRAAGIAVRVVLVLLMTLIAVTAIGIRFKLLLPGGWGTLGDRVSGGLSVVSSVAEWPYAGPNVWLRLTTLLAAPLVLVIAATIAFWPRRRETRAAYRGVALVLLVLLYAVAVAARPFDHQALRGLGLLACLAAWLWLPRLTGRDAKAAVVTIAIAAMVALVLTPRLASSDPWIDYRHWSWSLHKEKTVSFNWRHSYGPLHWPRKGTTLLLIKAKNPHYWKAESLDRFDGVGWTTSPLSDSDATVANTAVTQNPKWFESAHITVRGLKSQLVVGPGSLIGFNGLPGQPVVLSNATYLLNGQLESGDSYTVRGYTPDPSSRQMRAAPPPETFLERYTTLELPHIGGFATTVLHVPLRGQPRTGAGDAVQQIEASRYAPIYRLARRVSAGATTDYDIVRRVGAWLEGHYAYSENVPQRAYPLESFLFKDKRGYCQYFSGAAALMLRMLGIPVRVASGFAPGTLDTDTHEYVVRDLDAHSWIEVWFGGIGWVPFDPTPAQAPASSQAASFTPLSENASAARGDSKDKLLPKLREQILGAAGKGGANVAGAKQNSTPWGWIAAGVVVALLGIAAIVVSVVKLRRGRHPLPRPSGDAEVDHLVRQLWRLGLQVDPGTTLLELEKRMKRLGGPDLARYPQRLRRRRFGPNNEPAPGRGERRELRHALARAVGAGPFSRIHLVMPDNLGIRSGALKLRRPQRSP
jgi:transglutaminase-like putative cysteine protease